MSTVGSVLDMVGRIWSLPNTAIGLVFGIGGQVFWDAKHRLFRVHGGWMVREFTRRGYAGMCVGDVVLSSGPLPESIDAHERVHAVQARILGPLYLPLTLIGYGIGAAIFPKNPHDASPLECWADIASGNRERNAFLNRPKH